jgi:hypothetical protein
MITSPYSGQPVKPKLHKLDMGDKIHIEARWYCPSSGEFLQKGLVEIADKADEAACTARWMNSQNPADWPQPE